jgi:hypothetical protein
MLLPVIEFSKSTCQIVDSNPKSIEIRKNVGKLYKFLKNKIPLLHQLVIPFLRHQRKNTVGKLYVF